MPSLRPRLLLALALSAAAVARAEIEFSGLLITSERSMFALSADPVQAATWRALGQDFAGYKLAEFDAKANTLVLTKDGATLRVHLKDDAKVKSARMEIAGALKIGRKEKLTITRATLILGEENIIPLLDGLVCRITITPTRQPDGSLLYRASFERTDADGQPDVVTAPMVLALPTGSFNVEIGDIGFSFTPTTN